MNHLSKLTIKGFKTIRELKDFKPRSINLLIGENGAGKSNFIGFFRLLSWCVASVDRFQNFIAEHGFGSAFLFDGPEVTREIEWHLEIESHTGWNEYAARLVHGAGDILFFADEKVRYSKRGRPRNKHWISLGATHTESRLFEKKNEDRTVEVIFNLLRKIVVYQFHNTSAKAPIRNAWSIEDGKYLKETGSNLGSFLFYLFNNYPASYKNILLHLRTILPFFDDFVLEPERNSIQLRWREKYSERIFDATQASDGMLRFMALVALLNQPVENLPSVMFIDEPELGLHPRALETLAGMFKKVSRHCQLFIATQSVSLVDYFEPEDIVVVERQQRHSTFRRLSSQALRTWLENYSLSELWEKNVLNIPAP
ncbi:MAG: chromosome segregation protein SMC [Saprospiraceae bacterium]|nr:MAG: chromosome segregation protein SMC [Saprospiraceae bacterium]